MLIRKNFLVNNRCYQQAKKITPKGGIVHSLGVAQPNVDVFLNSWDNPSITKCVHAFIGENEVVQTLPWDYRCWGCASGSNGSGNNTHIQFEICEPAGHTYGKGSAMVGYVVKKNKKYFKSVWKNSTELAALLCEMYDLSADTIICHSEAYQKGIASNHGDVMHWFPKHNKSMDKFRKRVKKILKKGICPLDTPTTTIDQYSSYNDVLWLQWKLNHVFGANLKLDGVWGPKTELALMAYQNALGWLGSGKCGAKTIKALLKKRKK